MLKVRHNSVRPEPETAPEGNPQFAKVFKLYVEFVELRDRGDKNAEEARKALAEAYSEYAHWFATENPRIRITPDQSLCLLRRLTSNDRHQIGIDAYNISIRVPRTAEKITKPPKEKPAARLKELSASIRDSANGSLRRPR